MPSRKKAQGKARKAAKAEKAANAPPERFADVTLDDWLTTPASSACVEGKSEGVEKCKCDHGCDQSQSEHDCTELAMRFATDVLAVMSDIEGDGSNVRKAAVSHGHDVLSFGAKSCAPILNALERLFVGVSDDLNKSKWAVSFYLSKGTQDLIEGNLTRAQHAAICAEYVNVYAHMDMEHVSMSSDMKTLHDLIQANDKVILTYFRKRIPCSCLDKKRKEYRDKKKTGRCCNNKCPLPQNITAQSSLLCCSRCMFVHYCSAECQKQHWKYHKHQCTYFSKLNSYDLDAEALLAGALR